MTNTNPIDSPQIAGTRHGIMILAAVVMPIMAIISLVPVLPMLMDEFAHVPGGDFLVPMALTIPALCVALFSPLAGWMADKIGRKNLLVWSLVLYGCFGAIPWFLDDLYLILLARVALGIVEAAIMTVSSTLIGDYFDGARREKWIALQMGVGSIGGIFLIAIGGALGDAFGSRGPFLLYFLAFPVAVAAAIILFEPKFKTNLAEGLKEAFPFKVVIPLALTTLFCGLTFFTVIVQLGPILELAGPQSPTTIGLIGAIANVGVLAGTFIFNGMKKSAGYRLLILGLCIAAVGYLGIGFFTSLPLLAVSCILVCVAAGILLPNMLSWVMRVLPDQMRGRGVGMATGALFFGQFVAPLIVVGVLPLTGSFSTTLLIYAVIIILAAAFASVKMRSAN